MYFDVHTANSKCRKIHKSTILNIKLNSEIFAKYCAEDKKKKKKISITETRVHQTENRWKTKEHHWA